MSLDFMNYQESSYMCTCTCNISNNININNKAYIKRRRTSYIDYPESSYMCNISITLIQKYLKIFGFYYKKKNSEKN